jgi:monothiol glutaredoxin
MKRNMALEPELNQRITDLIASDRVVLFMKGSKHFPQCGFSATVTQILSKLVPEYTTVNVLSDPAIRDGIKAFSEWPTIPQLYVDGKFIGGCDIVRDMFQAGELQALLGVSAAPAAAAPAATAPKVTLTDAAKRAITEAKGSEPGTLRLEVSPSFEHALSIDEAGEADFEVDAGGVVVLVDHESAARANGVRIDFAAADGGGFTVDNPNEPPRVRQLSAQGLKTLMDAGESFELVDVRTPEERAIATIKGDRVLDAATEQHLEKLGKDVPVVFYCHHGGRSRAAADRFVRQGYRHVYNLAGGIDAWAASIDNSIARY